MPGGSGVCVICEDGEAVQYCLSLSCYRLAISSPEPVPHKPVYKTLARRFLPCLPLLSWQFRTRRSAWRWVRRPCDCSTLSYPRVHQVYVLIRPCVWSLLGVKYIWLLPGIQITNAARFYALPVVEVNNASGEESRYLG